MPRRQFYKSQERRGAGVSISRMPREASAAESGGGAQRAPNAWARPAVRTVPRLRGRATKALSPATGGTAPEGHALGPMTPLGGGCAVGGVVVARWTTLIAEPHLQPLARRRHRNGRRWRAPPASPCAGVGRGRDATLRRACPAVRQEEGALPPSDDPQVARCGGRWPGGRGLPRTNPGQAFHPLFTNPHPCVQ